MESKQDNNSNTSYKGFEHGNIIEYDSKGEYSAKDYNELIETAKKLKGLLDNIEINGGETTIHNCLKEHHTTTNGIVGLIKAVDQFDSSEDRGNANESQSICKTHKSSAFGNETEIEIDILTEERKKVYRLIIDYLNGYSSGNIDKLLEKRRKFFNELKISFSKTLGMTARGANDVLLWDHSYMSATFAKVSVIDCLVTDNNLSSKNDIKFKIFAVGWDYFGFVNQSQKIPDIIGRTKMIEKIKQEIRELIEREYLLGNQVYEDDNGIYFIVPYSFDKKIEDEIKREIFKKFNEKLKGIILPVFECTEEVETIVEITRVIDEIEKKIAHFHKDVPEKLKWMEEWDGNKKKVCPLCEKLPIKGKNDDLCKLCEELRRKGRETGDDIQTKFIDEIAWNNSKEDYENVALISAHFDLDRWLNGDFIRSLFVHSLENKEDLNFLFEYYKNEEDIKKIIKRFSSQGVLYGYIGRGNEQARENAKNKIREDINEYEKLNDFCKEIFKDNKLILNEISKILIEDSYNYKTLKNLLDNLNKRNKDIEHQERLVRKKLLNENFEREEKEIVQNARKIEEVLEKLFQKKSSASRLYRVWNDTKRFFENIEKDICQQVSLVEEAVIELQDRETIKDPYKPKKLSEGTLQLEIKVNERTMKGEGNKKGDNRITVVTPHLTSFIGNKKEIYLIKNGEKYSAKVIDKDKYKQYRTVSLSPSLFQFFVPASKSFDFIKLFKIKYEEEFSKVYGKLPLHIGITYFKRKEPIFLILDSSRRFHNIDSYLDSKNKMNILSVENITKEDGKIQLELSNKTSNIKININLKRGDENVDWYHPYILVDSCKSKNIIKSPAGDQVHFYELYEKDKVKILPNYFDFEFIDTSAKRFGIMIGKNGKRVHPLFGENGPRPYYLEEIEHIEELKKYLLEKEDDFKKKNTISQLHNFRTIIASKIEEWEKEDSALEEFVTDSIIHILKIRRSITKNGNEVRNPNFDFIKNTVLSGIFFDMMEIYHSITKTMEGEK